MSTHFTIRFKTGTLERLQRRSRLSNAPPRTLAQRYIEEGLRHDDHPLIHFIDGPSGRRAGLLGTGLDVWEVIATVRENDNDQGQAAEYLSVPAGIVQAAVAYYGAFREEIDERIASNDDEWQRGYEAWRSAEQALET